MVEVWQEDGLRVRGLDVFARATVTVPAGANFVVEGAVDFVGFGAEDGGEVVGHFEGGLCLEEGKVVRSRLSRCLDFRS